MCPEQGAVEAEVAPVERKSDSICRVRLKLQQEVIPLFLQFSGFLREMPSVVWVSMERMKMENVSYTRTG